MEHRSFVTIWFNRLVIVWQYLYEAYVAPFIAHFFWFVFLPLYWYLKKKQIIFVVNIAEGTGQVLPELSNLFLRISLGEISKINKYVWIRKKNDFSRACIGLYGNKFWYAVMNTWLYNITLPLTMRFHDITYDAGMSGLHWELPSTEPYVSPKPWQTFLYVDSKSKILELWREWYKRRLLKPSFYPLRQYAVNNLILSEELSAFLENDSQKIALVHIKENIMNATARVTDPATYIPALKHLVSQGYKLVFVGREKMPDVFLQFPIINYANSRYASFLHDLQLFSVAEIAITGGSGIAWIADTIGTPVLYLNSWHLFMPPGSLKCVYVPTLVRKKNGELLSFFDQFELYLKNDFSNGDSFPKEEYEAVNASAEDIVQGLLELLLMNNQVIPLDPLQKRFKDLHALGWTIFAESRISKSFVQKYVNLF